MIYGDRERLRAAERDDLPRFVVWFNDPEVRRGLAFYLPLSMVEEGHWFEQMLERPAPEHVWVIETKQEGNWIPVGTCGFHEFDWRARIGEVGIIIGEKSYWDKGIGTRTMQLLLRFGFNMLNLNRVALRVFTNNPRASRCYEKVSFVHEGRQRQAFYQDGSYYDVLLMSMIRSEWKDDARN